MDTRSSHAISHLNAAPFASRQAMHHAMADVAGNLDHADGLLLWFVAAQWRQSNPDQPLASALKLTLEQSP